MKDVFNCLCFFCCGVGFSVDNASEKSMAVPAMIAPVKAWMQLRFQAHIGRLEEISIIATT